MGDAEPTPAIDTSGLKCPLPVLKARKTLLGMKPGERLSVTATDPLSAIDLPHFCNEAGHRLISREEQNGTWVFLIERGAA